MPEGTYIVQHQCKQTHRGTLKTKIFVNESIISTTVSIILEFSYEFGQVKGVCTVDDFSHQNVQKVIQDA